MRSSSFIRFGTRSAQRITIERVGGELDHYYHFIVDQAWPLHHWLAVHSTGPEDQRIFGEDPASLHFSAHFYQILSRPIVPPGLLQQAQLWLRAPEEYRITGFNSRVRDYLKTFPTLAELQRSRQAFVSHIASSLPTQATADTTTVMLIEREQSVGDRGASRRNMPGHAALATALRDLCTREGARFKNVHLEKMSFTEQFQAMRSGRVILIGQHGAGLMNGLWMSDPSSAVVELACTDNPAHFTNLFTDLAQPFERLEFPAEGAYGQQQSLLVDPATVCASVARLMH